MTIIQDVNLVLTAITMLAVVLWTVEDKERWRYAGAILLVLLHMLIFYTVVLLDTVGIFTRPFEDFFTLWSSYVRTHLLISTLTSFCILIEWKKLWKILKKSDN
jgi:uncharacterized membrane protein YdjX (TVP38/TMEM64 family)